VVELAEERVLWAEILLKKGHSLLQLVQGLNPALLIE
jgi:hypothetical protein